jgi:subtilase family serine protease
VKVNDMRVVRTFSAFLTVALLAGPAIAQTSTPAMPAARIIERIDENLLVTLKGNTVFAANSQNDLGPVSPSLALTDMVLVLSRSQEAQSAFDDFVASQYDSSSPNFHRWLEPSEIGQKFGPSLTDIAIISNWLASHGFSVAEVSPDHMSILISGSAMQVQASFHTEIHNLSVQGERHIANMTDPQIPAALAPVVTGIKGLHDFHPKPLHHLGSRVILNSGTGMWVRDETADPFFAVGTDHQLATKPRPDFGITVSSGSSSGLIEDVTPYDFATIYNVLPLWNSNIDGSGQTIAIAGTSDINTADVATFRRVFGLPAGNILQQRSLQMALIRASARASAGRAQLTILSKIL